MGIFTGGRADIHLGQIHTWDMHLEADIHLEICTWRAGAHLGIYTWGEGVRPADILLELYTWRSDIHIG